MKASCSISAVILFGSITFIATDDDVAGGGESQRQDNFLYMYKDIYLYDSVYSLFP